MLSNITMNLPFEQFGSTQIQNGFINNQTSIISNKLHSVALSTTKIDLAQNIFENMINDCVKIEARQSWFEAIRNAEKKRWKPEPQRQESRNRVNLKLDSVCCAYQNRNTKSNIKTVPLVITNNWTTRALTAHHTKQVNCHFRSSKTTTGIKKTVAKQVRSSARGSKHLIASRILTRS